jgi:hypothetical protein
VNARRRNVRRIVLSAAVTAAFALAAALPAGADPPGGVQPACADITDGTAIYFDADGGFPYSVTSRVKTAAPTCKNVNYAVWIAYASGGNLIQTSQTKAGGDGRPLVIFDLISNVNAENSVVCVRFTSSRGNGDNIYDWAPDNSKKAPPFLDSTGQIDCNGWGVADVDSAGAGGGFN